VTGPGGRVVSYTSFVAPALLATSSMNGAVYDSTFNVFHKLKYAKVYDAALSTPLGPLDVALGEITWALSRGLLYAVTFLIVLAVLGLATSAWLILAVPASLLVSLAFAGLGMAATTFMRSWKDFDFIILATLPMFLFSTTFFPLGVYPRPLQLVVECTPLYQAVSLLRDLSFGHLSPAMLGNLAYLAALGLAGLYVASRRIRRLLLS
jgi:lipooligosaccharide transport system permease protein